MRVSPAPLRLLRHGATFSGGGNDSAGLQLLALVGSGWAPAGAGWRWLALAGSGWCRRPRLAIWLVDKRRADMVSLAHNPYRRCKMENELTQHVSRIACSLRGNNDNGILCALIAGLDYNQIRRADIGFLHTIEATVQDNVVYLSYYDKEPYKFAKIGVIATLKALQFSVSGQTIGVAAILALDHEGFREFDWRELERAGIISRTPWFVPHVRALDTIQYDALRETARKAVLDALS